MHAFNSNFNSFNLNLRRYNQVQVALVSAPVEGASSCVVVLHGRGGIENTQWTSSTPLGVL